MSRTGWKPIALATILLFSIALFAQAPPLQDTSVSRATPKINYGPAPILAVGQGITSYVQI